jgi:hypothetical protein
MWVRSFTDFYLARAAHVVPGCSLVIQCFRLTGTNQVYIRIAGTRAHTDVRPINTSVGDDHQCGCIGWVRTMDGTSGCGGGGGVCVATR